MLKQEEKQDVECRDEDTPEKRDVKQEIQGDGRADDLCKIAGGDGDFRRDPERNGRSSAVVGPAALRQIPACDDAKPQG